MVYKTTNAKKGKNGMERRVGHTAKREKGALKRAHTFPFFVKGLFQLKKMCVKP